MNVKKQHLETLYLVVKGTENILNLSESRKRDTFLKPLTEALETFYKERKVIYEKFCDKKEDGTPNIVENRYTFQNAEEVNKELTILLEETVELPPLEVSILEKSEYKPKIGEAEVIDEFITLCQN